MRMNKFTILLIELRKTQRSSLRWRSRRQLSCHQTRSFEKRLTICDKNCSWLCRNLTWRWITPFSKLAPNGNEVQKVKPQVSTEESVRTESVGKCKWPFSEPKSTCANFKIKKWRQNYTTSSWFKTKDWTLVSTSVTTRLRFWLSWWTITYWTWDIIKRRMQRRAREKNELT